jgi:hypothetical protein
VAKADLGKIKIDATPLFDALAEASRTMKLVGIMSAIGAEVLDPQPLKVTSPRDEAIARIADDIRYLLDGDDE